MRPLLDGAPIRCAPSPLDPSQIQGTGPFYRILRHMEGRCAWRKNDTRHGLFDFSDAQFRIDKAVWYKREKLDFSRSNRQNDDIINTVFLLIRLCAAFQVQVLYPSLCLNIPTPFFIKVFTLAVEYYFVKNWLSETLMSTKPGSNKERKWWHPVLDR